MTSSTTTPAASDLAAKLVAESEALNDDSNLLEDLFPNNELILAVAERLGKAHMRIYQMSKALEAKDSSAVLKELREKAENWDNIQQAIDTIEATGMKFTDFYNSCLTKSGCYKPPTEKQFIKFANALESYDHEETTLTFRKVFPDVPWAKWWKVSAKIDSALDKKEEKAE